MRKIKTIPKVRNMQSSRGNDVPNQFIIDDGKKEVFQSYRSIIAMKKDGKIYIDATYWDYSRTTLKYLHIFLGTESVGDIVLRVKSGELAFANLNP